MSSRRPRISAVLLAMLVVMGALVRVHSVLAQPEVTPSSDSPSTRIGTVRAILFDSPIRIYEDEILRLLPFQVGSELTNADVEQSIGVLKRKGVFDEVGVDVDPSPDGVAVTLRLVPYRQITDISVRGLSLLMEKDVLRVFGMRKGQYALHADLSAAVDRVRKYVLRQGLNDARVHATIVKPDDPLAAYIILEVDEGKPTTVTEASLVGPIPPEIPDLRDRFERTFLGEVTSERNLRRLRRELLRAVRAEGYLEASVEITVTPVRGTATARLLAQLDLEKPLSIVFEGNRRFSPEELLRLLRMDTRTVPFSPHAINALTTQIVQLYQEAGYFFARAQAAELPSNGDRQNYKISIAEGVQVTLRTITFSGNHRFSSGRLLSEMQTQPRGWWFVSRWRPGYIVSETLSQDLEHIRDRYVDEGYPRVAISFELKPVEGKPELDLLIAVDEGTSDIVRSVSLVWPDENPMIRANLPVAVQDELVLHLKEGDVFSAPAIAEERRRLEQVLTRAGFPNAEVSSQVDQQAGTITFEVTSGQFIRVGAILVAGNLNVHESTIRRSLAFQAGEPVSLDSFRISERRLSNRGLFRSVRVVPADGVYDSAVEDVLVKVTERETGTLKAGGSLNTEDGLFITGEISQRNIAGTGEQMLLAIDGYIKNSSRILDAGAMRALYRRPGLWSGGPDFRLEGFGQFSYRLVDPFTVDRQGATVSLDQPYAGALHLETGLTGFQESLSDVPFDMTLGPDDVGSSLRAFVFSKLELDRRDNPFNPREGFRAAVDLRLANEALQSDGEFFGVGFALSVHLPLDTRTVWMQRANVRRLVPYGNTEVIPLGERLFLGGRTSLRGFERNDVGPIGVAGDIVGGDTSVLYSNELQYDITETVVGVAFMDIGQSYLQEAGVTPLAEDLQSGFHLKDLRYTPGFGLRYKTPIGPLSAEYGFVLDPEPRDRLGQLHVGIGLAF